MALAFIPPHEAAKQRRKMALNDMLKSPDPITRYRAKETVISDCMTELSGALVRQGVAASEAKRQLDKYYKENGW